MEKFGNEAVDKKKRSRGLAAAAALSGAAALGTYAVMSGDESSEGHQDHMTERGLDVDDTRRGVIESEGPLYSEDDRMGGEITVSLVQEQVNRILKHGLTLKLVEDELRVQSVALDTATKTATAFVEIGDKTLLIDMSRFVDVSDGKLIATPSAIGGVLIIELEKQGIIRFSHPTQSI